MLEVRCASDIPGNMDMSFYTDSHDIEYLLECHPHIAKYGLHITGAIVRWDNLRAIEVWVTDAIYPRSRYAPFMRVV